MSFRQHRKHLSPSSINPPPSVNQTDSFPSKTTPETTPSRATLLSDSEAAGSTVAQRPSLTTCETSLRYKHNIRAPKTQTQNKNIEKKEKKMSEPIPESIPTSADPRSHRPLKKSRTAASPSTKNPQAAQVTALFAKPDRHIHIPPSTTSTSLSKTPAPPEIVANVQGSSAGAGSGEFHVYKASRRREYERLRLMDEEVSKEEQDRVARERREEVERRDRERTEKNREKREKARLRKEKGKMKMKGGKEGNGEGGLKKKLVPNSVGKGGVGGAEDDAKEGGEGEGRTDEGGEVKGVAVEQEEVGLVIEDDD
ncbi:unnamed protein product [Periconia digitata]|uniref:DUF1168-domain-containing protein n=1 Tax=Periconia digitata TaxID=1303443 RepID=A0A9W4UUB7_9PLEO|nr:unnamed protein product [Periconia digitata]